MGAETAGRGQPRPTNPGAVVARVTVAAAFTPSAW